MMLKISKGIYIHFLTILLFVFCYILTGCWDKAEYVELVRLGARDKTIVLKDCEYGDSTFNIISNVDYKFEVLSGGDWLTVTEACADSICFSFPTNNGFKRSAEIRLSYGPRVDDLKVKQPGKYEMRLALSEKRIEVPVEGGTYQIDVRTNVLQRDLFVEVSSEKAIKDVSLADNRLTFTVPATSSFNPRTYSITVYTVDGWGERLEAVLELPQTPNQMPKN